MSTTLKNILVTPEGLAAVQADSFTITRVLAANTAETFAIPQYATHCLITTTGNTFVSYTPTDISDVTATVPAADITDGTSPELCTASFPTPRALFGISKISVISSAINTVSIIFFRS